jgi:hypothetical protein
MTMQNGDLTTLSLDVDPEHAPGQKKIPNARGRAGMKAEANCKRHAIFPTFSTTTFAANPRKMPNAV